jgi:methylglyoxal reductase
VSRANLAVAWALGTPGVSAALVGAPNPAQARENARAAELRLDPEERRLVSDALAGIV